MYSRNVGQLDLADCRNLQWLNNCQALLKRAVVHLYAYAYLKALALLYTLLCSTLAAALLFCSLNFHYCFKFQAHFVNFSEFRFSSQTCLTFAFFSLPDYNLELLCRMLATTLFRSGILLRQSVQEHGIFENNSEYSVPNCTWSILLLISRNSAR